MHILLMLKMGREIAGEHSGALLLVKVKHWISVTVEFFQKMVT